MLTVQSPAQPLVGSTCVEASTWLRIGVSSGGSHCAYLPLHHACLQVGLAECVCIRYLLATMERWSDGVGCARDARLLRLGIRKP